jgi:hypothetical protein
MLTEFIYLLNKFIFFSFIFNGTHIHAHFYMHTHEDATTYLKFYTVAQTEHHFQLFFSVN